MLKKIALGVALALALATVSAASILLEIGSEEQGVEMSSTIDTLVMTSRAGDLPEQTPADAI